MTVKMCPETATDIKPLIKRLEACEEKGPTWCIGCRKRKACVKWWNGVSEASSRYRLSGKRLTWYKKRFDKLQVRVR